MEIIKKIKKLQMVCLSMIIMPLTGLSGCSSGQEMTTQQGEGIEAEKAEHQGTLEKLE